MPSETVQRFPAGLDHVLFGQFQHAVLDDIEGTLLVAHGIHGLFERAAFNGFEKVSQFVG